MKNSFRFLITILCILSISSVYGQWTTSGTNVGLTVPTNNVIVGPTPTSPTQLHFNGPNLNHIFTIENTAAGYPNETYTGIQFKGTAGMPFEIYTNYKYGPGSGLFHLKPIGTAAGIHFSGTGIAFSDNICGSGCGNSIGSGKYVFDGAIGTSSGVNIGYHPNWMSPPAGYKLTNSGLSYFKDKVVIGTTNTAIPTGTHKLYVGGSVICEELVVKLQANWPDFVFAPSYKLMPLNQVKTYIAENSHLPGVPAACDVEENGVATGEMLTIQMKKIEELTLYLIQMEERIKELEAQNKAFQK